VAASIWGIVAFLQGELFGSGLFGGTSIDAPGTDGGNGFNIQLGF